MALVRILVVDDFEPWRRCVTSQLQEEPHLCVIYVASDGVEAVQKAESLLPDLIILDIGLPKLNGIEAALQIRELSPATKILFVSHNSGPDVARAALGAGHGYVLKSHAAFELKSAVHAVLLGRQFVSRHFAAHGLVQSAAD